MPDYTSAQFDASKYNEAQNRAYATLAAVCGPEVAAAFARYYGKSISPDQIVNTARQYGLWTAQSGMRGPQAQKALLDQLGIPVQFSPEVNSAALQQAMAQGQTGAISTPNHYFFLQGYDPNTGRYDTGQTGSVYRGGNRYLTLDDIKRIGGGLQGQFISTAPGAPFDPNYSFNPRQSAPASQPSRPQPTGLPNIFGDSRINAPVRMPSNELRPGVSYNGGGLSYEDKEAVKQYIRYSAASRNIDPEVAVRVAGSEGLNTYVGDQGSSFGPYQLHYGGVASGGNRVGGLGDTFTQVTGLDARDPSTIQAQIDFTLDRVKSGGWGPWHGAKAIGIGAFTGVGTYNGDPNQYGDYSSTSQPSGGGFSSAGGVRQPTGLPAIRMGSMVNQGGLEYSYPTSPTITPPLTQGTGWY